MKVLTLNTWQERGPWKQRWEVIFEGLKTLQPDLVFFQEIFNPEWIKQISSRTQFATTVYHEPASGLALFSRYPLLDSGSLTLKEQSSREDYRRYLLFGKFQTDAGIFFAFNTHLSWMLEDSAVRAAQTQEIGNAVQEIAGSAESLSAGDFNSVAESAEIRSLTGRNKFTDIYQVLNPAEIGLTWTRDNAYTRQTRHPLPDRRIDYIFSSQGRALFGQPKSARVVFEAPDSKGVLASDHYGVFAEFDLAGGR